MAKPGKTGLTRIIHAFGYSMKGLKAALKHESAFRQELTLFLILLPLAILVGKNWLQYILLIGRSTSCPDCRTLHFPPMLHYPRLTPVTPGGTVWFTTDQNRQSKPPVKTA